MTYTPTTDNIPHKQYRAHISTNGRLNLPAQFRKAAKLRDGDEVLLTLKGNTIQVQPLDQVITEAQSIVAEYFGKDNLMDDLKSMRADDASRETQKLGNKE
jgi:bifunctional DNA-binding transcriptional regulator/antitoxin component of YhaV-PrlF toxin-antitoxin module